jgi:hypothetical protein
MFLKTKKELESFINTTGEGTKQNPKVFQLPWNYKLPLYLGYVIKWDYDFYMEKTYNPIYKETLVYEIKPYFKQSHESFNCLWDYTSWDFVMDILLPKMEKDNLITDDIRKEVLKFNRGLVTFKCFDIINKYVKDIDYPFVNIVNRVENANQKIF